MATKVFSLDTKPGIQRDGTVFDKVFYSDGEWVRFQRGRPRKIGGFRVISDQLTGPSRGIWVNPQNAFTSIFSGYNDGLQVLTIDNNGVGSGVGNFTLSNFTASDINLWQFDGFYDVSGLGYQSLVAHPGLNLASISNDNNTPVLIGDITALTMSQIGVFTASGTTTNTSTTVTLAASNPLIGAGQTVTGAGILANTTVVSISTTTLVISNAATASATVTLTFNNNISVSGGVVSLHPYLFVYGNNGLCWVALAAYQGVQRRAGASLHQVKTLGAYAPAWIKLEAVKVAVCARINCAGGKPRGHSLANIFSGNNRSDAANNA